MVAQRGFGVLEVLMVLVLASSLAIAGWQLLPRFTATPLSEPSLQLNVNDQAKLRLLRLQAQQRQLFMQQQGG